MALRGSRLAARLLRLFPAVVGSSLGAHTSVIDSCGMSGGHGSSYAALAQSALGTGAAYVALLLVALDRFDSRVGDQAHPPGRRCAGDAARPAVWGRGGSLVATALHGRWRTSCGRSPSSGSRSSTASSGPSPSRCSRGWHRPVHARRAGGRSRAWWSVRGCPPRPPCSARSLTSALSPGRPWPLRCCSLVGPKRSSPRTRLRSAYPRLPWRVCASARPLPRARSRDPGRRSCGRPATGFWHRRHGWIAGGPRRIRRHAAVCGHLQRRPAAACAGRARKRRTPASRCS